MNDPKSNKVLSKNDRPQKEGQSYLKKSIRHDFEALDDPDFGAEQQPGNAGVSMSMRLFQGQPATPGTSAVQTHLVSWPLLVKAAGVSSVYSISGSLFYRLQEGQIQLVGLSFDSRHVEGDELEGLRFECIGQASGQVVGQDFEFCGSVAYSDKNHQRLELQATFSGRTHVGQIQTLGFCAQGETITVSPAG